MNKQGIFIGILFSVILYLNYILYQNYLFDLLIATIFTIATFDIYTQLEKRLKNSTLASFILLFAVLILIFAPIGYLFVKAAAFAATINMEQIEQKLQALALLTKSALASIPGLEEKVNEVYKDLNIGAISKEILSFLASFTKGSANFIIDAMFIAIFYFFLNIYGKRILDFTLKALPIERENANELMHQGGVTIKAVFYSMFITAFLQGLLFGIFVAFFGLDGLLLGLLYGLASMIPVVGGGLVWIPTSAYLFFQGSSIGAIAVAIYSIIVLATLVDNFVRPIIVGWLNNKVLKTDRGLNEILVFFSMLAGLGQFGFFGIILGPAIMALLLSILKLLQIKNKEGFTD